MSAARRLVSAGLTLASLVAAWALLAPFHVVTVAGAGGAPETLLHRGITHHSWGLMFIPTALALALLGLAGAWSNRSRARTYSRVASLGAITWALVVLGDGFLTDYLMTRGPALYGERAFVAAHAWVAVSGVGLGVLSLFEREAG